MTLIDPAPHRAPTRCFATPAQPHRQPLRSPVDTRTAAPVLDVTIPVFNDEARIEASLRQLHAYLVDRFPHSFRITVADIASTDNTLKIAERLARELPELTVTRFNERGRGNALRQVWLASPSPVLAYMEAGLPVDLAALGPLVAPLISGHSDLAIGTRLARTSRVIRGPKRDLVSRMYNRLLRWAMGARFSDAQCGFKAIRADVAHRLLPHIKDDAWFFDTELLMVAERCGLRIHEVPVDWADDPNSGVDVVRTALADLRGMGRLGRDLATARIPIPELRTELGRAPSPVAPRTLRRMLRAGALCVGYVLAFLLFRNFMGAQLANLAALLLATAATRDHLRGLLDFGPRLVLTSGALALVDAMTTPGRWLEVAALLCGFLAAAAARRIFFPPRLAPDVA